MHKEKKRMLKATNQAYVEGEALLQSYAQFLPTLDAGAEYSLESGKAPIAATGLNVVESRNYGPSFNLTASLNLFRGFSDWSHFKASRERKSAADLNLERSRQEIALDIAQSFLQVVLDQDLVEIAKKNLSASQAQERLISASAQAGIRNKSDWYQQQAQTASDESYFTSTQNKKRTDLLLLLRKIRLDVGQNYRVIRPPLPRDAVANPRYANERELIELALKHRPDLESSQRNASANHQDVVVAGASYLPQLNLSFTVDGAARHYNTLYVDGVNQLPPTQRSIGTQLGDQVEWILGLSLSWNIFDRGLTRLNVAQAQIAADNADIDSDDKKKQVIGEVRQTFGDYRAALQQLASSEAGLTAAQKAYDLMRGRYEVGASSYVDLVTAQSALVRAEGARSQAIVSYQLQAQAMEVALGTF